MHDLVLIDPAVPGALTRVEIESVAGYLQNEKAESTRKCYASDWKDFEQWCGERGLVPLPALAGTVAAYLSHLADRGRKASTIARRGAAIGYRHRCAGHEPPTNSEGVKATMRGIRRTIGVAKTQKAAATASVVRQMIDACPEDELIGLRDRALISFGLASAMRRSELCALEVADLSWVDDGVCVLIRRSKTDQEGAGQEIAVPRGLKLCPVASLQAWLAAAGITEGRVFRAVLQGGRVQASLTPECLSRVIKKLARRIGLDPKDFAGHSTRAGFVTSAVEVGAPLMKIAEQTRHRSLAMLQTYSRRVDLFKDHAGAAFL
jgi:integrase